MRTFKLMCHVGLFMASSDKPLIFKLSEGAKLIPISKKCRICKEEKLLSAFDFSNKAKNKRAATCKNCMEESDKPVYGACCQHHFGEMMINSTHYQLELLLQVVEALQCNKAEIPRELLEKMFRITHLAGVRCRYDSCDYDRKKND